MFTYRSSAVFVSRYSRRILRIGVSSLCLSLQGKVRSYLCRRYTLFIFRDLVLMNAYYTGFDCLGSFFNLIDLPLYRYYGRGPVTVNSRPYDGEMFGGPCQTLRFP